MSEIAGKMAPIVGSYFLQRIYGGSGILPAGVAGLKPAKALILGAGVVGTNAARISTGIGMETVVISKGLDKLKQISDMFPVKIKTLPQSLENIMNEIKDADIIIGAVHEPGGKTPVLITRDMLKMIKKGSVIVDVSIDQGGCVETSRPTSHENPVFEVDGIIHYAVENMPGAFPRTSTISLTNATLPYIKKIADMGIENAIRLDNAIKSALNTHRGQIVHKRLADSIGSKK